MEISTTYDLFSLVGLFGVVLYVGAYAGLQFGLIAGQSYQYSLLNLGAASCVLLSLATHFNLSSALIQIFWIALSAIGIARIYWLSAMIKFTSEERAFLDSKFPTLSKPQARKFLDSGFWVDAPADIRLVTEDHPVTELIYLANGSAVASLDGEKVGACAPGSLIGEVTCITGDPASATVTTNEVSRYFSIGTGRVRQLYNQSAEFRSAIDNAFADDIGRKLRAANRSANRRNNAAAA